MIQQWKLRKSKNAAKYYNSGYYLVLLKLHIGYLWFNYSVWIKPSRETNLINVVLLMLSILHRKHTWDICSVCSAKAFTLLKH